MRFIEPMLLLRTEKLPEGPDLLYEIKFDGYRALAIKTGGKVQLRSRNDYDFNGRYPGIVKALAPMPDETIIDGEVVALDEDGRPSFNTLQNYGSAGAPLHFYIFDLLMLEGRDVMREPLVKRRLRRCDLASPVNSSARPTGLRAAARLFFSASMMSTTGAVAAGCGWPVATSRPWILAAISAPLAEGRYPSSGRFRNLTRNLH